MIPLAPLNKMLASPDMYWAKALPEEVLRPMLQASLCFGLYDTKQCACTNPESHTSTNDARHSASSEQTPSASPTHAQNTSPGALIGFARCATDHTTVVYLTDVHVLPSYSGKGLGTWLIYCVQEVIKSMPHLRQSMLLTADWERSVPFYEKLMGMEIIEGKRTAGGTGGEGMAVMWGKGKRHFMNDDAGRH